MNLENFISISTLRIVSRTLRRLDLCNDFERKFLRSLTMQKNMMCPEYELQPLLLKFKDEIYLSDKQILIYRKLENRFKKLDLYNKYLDYFDIHNIKLSDFDKGYFETFIGEYEESNSFKKWFKEVSRN